GAFGIAMANNFINIRHAQHRSDIVSNMYDGAPALMERINGISQSMIAKTGDAATAVSQAYKYIDLAVDRQSYYLAYLDTFRLVGFFFVAVIPFAFLIKAKKKPAMDPAAARKAMEKALEEAH